MRACLKLNRERNPEKLQEGEKLLNYPIVCHNWATPLASQVIDPSVFSADMLPNFYAFRL